MVTNFNKYPLLGNSVNRYESQPGYAGLETKYIHNENQAGYRLYAALWHCCKQARLYKNRLTSNLLCLFPRHPPKKPTCSLTLGT
jgi:hypothetical protein